MSIASKINITKPAITGPATKIWWMTISYSTPGAKGEAGGSDWKMGGLGVCKVGDVCKGAGSGLAPAVSGQIKSVLMYHFAVAAMVFLIGVAQLIMMPRKEGSTWKGWTTFFLSIFATLLVISVMGVDLIVRAHLMKDKAIGELRAEGVFWLSTSAAISSVFWAISAYQLQRLKYDKTADSMKANAAAAEEAERQKRKPVAMKEKTFWQKVSTLSP